MTNRVAALQMVSSGDIHQNLESAARLIESAVAKGADLVLLPENFAVLDGGPLRQFAEIEGADDALLQDFLAGQASSHRITLVGGTIPLLSRPSAGNTSQPSLLDDGRVRPACMVYNDAGELTARYDKIHLFDVTVEDRQAEYSESKSFEPGEEVVTVASPAGQLGLSICYDLRFPELYRRLREAGAEIVTVPSAFTRTTGAAHWEVLLRARAIENQCYVIAANQGGVHNKTRETFGHSMIVDPWGEVLDCVAQGEGVAVADLDLEFLAKVRRDMPIASHRRL
ncbi:MAG: carbon-nitrogen hydrolase family protein [Gammaproteobacteria bacterium]|nr:carbon-nitrogen hydrolase family protein [Gammaproteobacteria bacterium]